MVFTTSMVGMVLASASKPLIGDIFLTRNTDEIGNDSPGYWNHAAIYGSSGYVVEAQRDPNSVIAVELESFERRYPHYIVLRYHVRHAAEQAGMHAFSRIGQPYAERASLFFWRRRGENCVSVVREAYKYATQHDPGWWRPDSIFDDKQLDVVFEHKDYENWIQPEDWLEGQTYFNP